MSDVRLHAIFFLWFFMNIWEKFQSYKWTISFNVIKSQNQAYYPHTHSVKHWMKLLKKTKSKKTTKYFYVMHKYPTHIHVVVLCVHWNSPVEFFFALWYLILFILYVCASHLVRGFVLCNNLLLVVSLCD